jgi:hypothetical protein
MRTAIIINNIDNQSLLKFTETKLFFDAKNQGITFVNDCIIVDSLESAISIANQLESAVILNVGEFLTTNYRDKNKNNTGILIATGDADVIVVDPDTYVGFAKRCKYIQGSKQLYIIENLLKTCLRSRDLVYLDNTEEVGSIPNVAIDHLYGLASGWKTVQLAEQIGLDKLKSITVYDFNLKQLAHAEQLHSYTSLPEHLEISYKNTCGKYNPNAISKEFWAKWSRYPVKFEQINLFDNPTFLPNSLVWISNVFLYEPNIFNFGWKQCKDAKNQLINSNKECIII